LIEHGRSNYWEWLDKVLDDGKDKHVEKWGCEWNRDIDRLVKDSGLVVESRTKVRISAASHRLQYYIRLTQVPPPAKVALWNNYIYQWKT